MTTINGVSVYPSPEKHLVLNYGCSEWRSSSQCAADLYNRGKKLWKKEDLRDIENQLAESLVRQMFAVRRIDGELVYIRNPNFGVQNPIWVPFVEFREYWRLVKEQPNRPPETYHCSYLPQWRNSTLLNFREHTESLAPRFQEIKRAWNDSVSSKLLRTHIETHLGLRKVTKIICFGIGDMCRKLPEWLIEKNKSQQESETNMSEQTLRMVQHSIACTLADACQNSGRETVRLLAQDPDYTTQSREILEASGFEIVGLFGAEGFSEIDADSIVFAPFASAPVKQILADVARPALVISSGFSAFNNNECDTFPSVFSTDSNYILENLGQTQILLELCRCGKNIRSTTFRSLLRTPGCKTAPYTS